jgi:hypothetical protein
MKLPFMLGFSHPKKYLVPCLTRVSCVKTRKIVKKIRFFSALWLARYRFTAVDPGGFKLLGSNYEEKKNTEIKKNPMSVSLLKGSNEDVN